MDDIAPRIEHTVLGPETTPADVESVLDAARKFGMRACLPPCYLDVAAEYAPNVETTTVVGFPHGQQTTATKVAEAREAWQSSVDELDVVCNVGRLRAGQDDSYRDELAEVVAAVPIPVKAIVETPLLTDAEKHRACQLVADADADFVKTATGFSDGGATVADVELLSDYLPVKASGGIGSWSDAKAMFDAGADRIGASAGVAIVEGYRNAAEE